MTDVFTPPEQTAAIEAIVTRVLTPRRSSSRWSRAICGLGPVDRPDDKGRHQNCGGEHDDGRPHLAALHTLRQLDVRPARRRSC